MPSAVLSRAQNYLALHLFRLVIHLHVLNVVLVARALVLQIDFICSLFSPFLLMRGKQAFSKRQAALRLSHFQWQNDILPFSHTILQGG